MKKERKFEIIQKIKELNSLAENNQFNFSEIEKLTSELQILVLSESNKIAKNVYDIDATNFLITIEKSKTKYKEDKLRLNVLTLLPGVISLTVKEKKRVIDALQRLTENQLKELIKIFKEEAIKFKELEKEYDSDLKELKTSREIKKSSIKQTKNQ